MNVTIQQAREAGLSPDHDMTFLVRWGRTPREVEPVSAWIQAPAPIRWVKNPCTATVAQEAIRAVIVDPEIRRALAPLWRYLQAFRGHPEGVTHPDIAIRMASVVVAVAAGEVEGQAAQSVLERRLHNLLSWSGEWAMEIVGEAVRVAVQRKRTMPELDTASKSALYRVLGSPTAARDVYFGAVVVSGSGLFPQLMTAARDVVVQLERGTRLRRMDLPAPDSIFGRKPIGQKEADILTVARQWVEALRREGADNRLDTVIRVPAWLVAESQADQLWAAVQS